MSDIWSIIGISSLIASVVTVVLGLFRELLVDKFRFKRESEAGYIQKQLEVYYQMYYLLEGARGLSAGSSFMGDFTRDFRSFNDSLIKNYNLAININHLFKINLSNKL